MHYYLGLIPSASSFKIIQSIRDKLILKYQIRDYRQKPIFHVTIGYYKKESISDLANILKVLNLSNVYLSSPIILNIKNLTRWKNGKVAFILDNKALFNMIKEIERATKPYNINQEYRKEVSQFYTHDTEHIGDHLKLIRNVNQDIWDNINTSDIHNSLSEIRFDKIGLFNADYSEFILL